MNTCIAVYEGDHPEDPDLCDLPEGHEGAHEDHVTGFEWAD